MQPSCDMCGRSGARFIARIAGAQMTVCENCAQRGEIIEEIVEKKPAEVRREIKREEQKAQIVERVDDVLENIGELVRKKREELNLKQEDLSKKINEHESMIKRIEHGYMPSLQIAHKLEKVLHVRLTEKSTASDQNYDSGKGAAALTLGDIMIIRDSKGGK